MVYHGPSGGCKTCRTRRVKCDQTKPHCNNCTRRRQSCPGYGDVFDGAHRNQNNAIVRRMKRQNHPYEVQSTHGTPSSERSIEQPPSTSEALSRVSGPSPKSPLQWVFYSAPTEHLPETPESERDHATELNLQKLNKSALTIPGMVKQDPEEASIYFFFHYYSGIINEPHTRPLTMLWEPMYLRSSSESPLRIATAAVTVNIAMMWNYHGCDAGPARRLYAKAISAMRQALSNPSTSTSDELLMTTLIFDLYDSLLAHFLPELPQPGKHKRGALALVKHRGTSNFATEVGRELVNVTRQTILGHALAWRKPFPPGAEQYFDHSSLSEGKIQQMDNIAVLLANAQSHFWALRRERLLCKDLDHLRLSYEEVIAEAMRIDGLMVAWQRSITYPEWFPLYVQREEVAPTIQAAGFYGNRCAVWKHVGYGSTWILFYERRLHTLQMIRQAYADEPRLLENAESRAMLAWANSVMQVLADDICEIVPFFLGDTVVPTNPIYSDEINYPYKEVSDSQSGRAIRIPSMDSTHRTRAAASGGWTLFTHLIALYRLAEPEDDAAPLVLREGQLDWVKGQIKRLQTTFMFSNPPW
ncbi:hypothetical protein A1O3_01417 [Capronia epimyces CBS 606.96]|uniref:Zn(2)-C6 fungal-type domain-containing protein n=1 Tax=Capronia epimyces CBS 606.96 TaxID=1182542 RepID=W9YK11_9EURO|nr:uncharacterized protein A1O3_01417 [Capronia epimyces CBS 606.96]EXJ92863.1 hypothetical protein A1O3_01417 [Capronia epimyces CBS 606.96]